MKSFNVFCYIVEIMALIYAWAYISFECWQHWWMVPTVIGCFVVIVARFLSLLEVLGVFETVNDPNE